MIHLGQLLTLALVTLSLLSCSTIGYYKQAAGGQMDILSRSQPIEKVLADPAASDELKSQLTLSKRLLSFAETELSLDSGTAYSAYADLEREYVVWNIFAAPELSLEPKQWRYPIVGKLNYRGYFSEEDANKSAQLLEAEGYDTIVGGVTAYSTLGWFRDPLLNTFIHENEIALAELIFHELTHRKIFRKGETEFNEALATAVSYEGVRRWLKSEGKTDLLRRYELLLKRRAKFYQHIESAREELKTVYASDLSREAKLHKKRQILDTLQADFRQLRRRWQRAGVKKAKGGEHWLNQPLNNAHLVASATYHELVPAFERLLTEHNGNLASFFKSAKKLPPLDQIKTP